MIFPKMMLDQLNKMGEGNRLSALILILICLSIFCRSSRQPSFLPRPDLGDVSQANGNP
jgi:hypothetical protein